MKSDNEHEILKIREMCPQEILKGPPKIEPPEILKIREHCQNKQELNNNTNKMIDNSQDDEDNDENNDRLRDRREKMKKQKIPPILLS